MGAMERIAAIADEGSFKETDSNIKSKDPINFPGYEEKRKEISKTEDIVDKYEDKLSTYLVKISSKPFEFLTFVFFVCIIEYIKNNYKKDDGYV